MNSIILIVASMKLMSLARYNAKFGQLAKLVE